MLAELRRQLGNRFESGATMKGAALAIGLMGLAAHALGAERAIDKEVVVAAPIEAVWQSWTTKAGIEAFFAPEAEIDARVGGAFHIHIDPLAAPGLKGAD